MIAKDYIFTIQEMRCIRDALIEEYQRVKHIDNDRTKTIAALKEQFKLDVMLTK